MAGRKDDRDNADGEGRSRRMVLVAEKLAVPFCCDDVRTKNIPPFKASEEMQTMQTSHICTDLWLVD